MRSLALSLPDSYRAVFLIGRQEVQLRRVPMVLPTAGEILVHIEAATTCGTDVKVFRLGGHPRMLRAPSAFGHEMAGTVVACGEGVDAWRTGDRIVVVNSASCGTCPYCLQNRENLCSELQFLNGAFAEYLLVPRRFVERSTHPIPPDLLSEQAALTEPLACVLHGIEACQISRHAEILVLGGGPIGQLLVGSLATEGHRVCLVDSNESRRAVASRMGAERVMDRQEHRQSAASFDLGVDATGTLKGWNQALQSVHPGGQVLLLGGCPPGSRLELDTGHIHYDELTLRGAYHHRPATAKRALELLSERRFPAELLLTAHSGLEGTEEALRSMMRRKNLKVVLEP
jgi:L-iditol 2-dehydrogenase